jgi:hypothetical protein
LAREPKAEDIAMVDVVLGTRTEKLLSELATATYRVAKRQGFKDAFIDIELDLWYARQVTAGQSPAMNLAKNMTGTVAE